MAETNLRVVDRDTMDRSANEKSKALEAALGQIERDHGKGSIMKLGEGSAPIDIEAVSTGSIGLDIALGIGGVPRGRIVEIYGPESSGKTTLALHIVAEAQSMGRPVVVADHGGAAEQVRSGETGWLFAPGNAGSLMRTLDQALSISAEQRAAISAASQDHVRRLYTRRGMCAATLAVYAELTQSMASA